MEKKELSASDIAAAVSLGRKMRRCGVDNFNDRKTTNRVFSDFNRIVQELGSFSVSNNATLLNFWLYYLGNRYKNYQELYYYKKRTSMDAGKAILEHLVYAKDGARDAVRSIVSHNSQEASVADEILQRNAVVVAPMTSGAMLLSLVFAQAKLQHHQTPRITPALVDLDLGRAKLPRFWRMPWNTPFFVDDIIGESAITSKLTLRAMGMR